MPNRDSDSVYMQNKIYCVFSMNNLLAERI